MSSDRFRCVFVVSLRHEGVPWIGRLVVSLFRRCIIFCKECKLCSRWHWLRYRWSDQWSGWIACVPIFSQRCQWKDMFNIPREYWKRKPITEMCPRKFGTKKGGGDLFLFLMQTSNFYCWSSSSSQQLHVTSIFKWATFDISSIFNMAARLSGQNCKSFKILLAVDSQSRRIQRKQHQIRSLCWKPRSHVRILIYRTWPIYI